MPSQSNYRYCNNNSLGTSSQAATEQKILDMFLGLKLKKIFLPQTAIRLNKDIFKANTKTPYYTNRSTFRTEHFVEYSNQNYSTDTTKFVTRIGIHASAP